MDEPSQVTFREENYNITRPQRSDQKTGIVTRAVIALGLAEDEKGAQSILLYVAVAALLLAAVVFFGLTPKSKL